MELPLPHGHLNMRLLKVAVQPFTAVPASRDRAGLLPHINPAVHQATEDASLHSIADEMVSAEVLGHGLEWLFAQCVKVGMRNGEKH